MTDADDIKEEIRARVPLLALCERVHVVGLRREGTRWKGCCPFHVEKSPSFMIGGKSPDVAHCFGCGWSGDIFSFWMETQGLDFKGALEQLAGIAGLPWRGVEFVKRDVKRVRQPERRPDFSPGGAKPSLPSLRHLKREECAVLAAGRGLDPEAVWVAARVFGRAAYSAWPLFQRRGGAWLPRCEAHGKFCLLDQPGCVAAATYPSWVVTDETRNVAEYRRLDNGRYPRMDDGEIKSWSTAGKAWPVGAASLNGRKAVALVEGGPDLLAAYQFLMQHGLLDRVAVVCMLGAGNRMREDALEHFKGCRVRIFVDADPLKDHEDAKKRKVPGIEAAARWQGQLTAAGAAVETFSVGPIYDPAGLQAWGRGELPGAEVPVRHPGLALPDGRPVKDLNDLALCSREVRESADVREAFRCWDF